MNIAVTVLPMDATEQAVTFKSSNTSIATVSSTGEVRDIYLQER